MTHHDERAHDPDFSVDRMYHPSHRVLDLDEAEDFFRRVFGRYSINRSGLEMAGVLRRIASHDSYASDYLILTPIADVLFDCVDPSRLLIDGKQKYPPIEESHLVGLGWAVNGTDELLRRLQAAGIRCIDQNDRVAAPGEMPRSLTTGTPLIWTLPEDTGLRFEFCEADTISYQDPRSDPDWVLPPVHPLDPLGIERAARHTILTDNIERALTVPVNILGGRIIHTGYNEALGTESTFVRIVNDVYEYALPPESGPVRADWAERAPDDTYHSITWKVADLDRVVDHLTVNGIGIRTRTESTVITDPADSIGIPFGFTTVLTPGDDR